MGYKMLGFVVWHGAQWYVRKRMRNMVPSRRTASAAAVVVGAVSVAAVLAARRGD
jgi:predicted MFS family arabinose efflux permease